MDLDGLTEIQSRYGKAMLEETLSTHAPLLKAGIPKQTIKQDVAQINVTPGVMAGGPIADGSAYSFATRGTVSTLFAHRSLWVSIVKIPIGVASATSGTGDSIRLVKQYEDEQFGTLAMQLEQAYFSNTIGLCDTTSSAIAANAVTVACYDVTRFRVGQTYLWSDNGTINANPFTCTAVSIDTDGVSGTVSFTTDATGTITANEDSFLVNDASNDRSLWSLEELAGSGNVYTQSAAITGYHGESLDQGGAYTAEGVLKLLTRMRQRNANPDLLFVSPKVEERHRALYGGSSYLRVNAESKNTDPYGNEPLRIAGVRALVSPNVPANKIFAIDSKMVKLGVYKDWEPLMGKAPVVSQDGYNLLTAKHGHYQTVAHNRKGVGMLSGITF